MSFFYTYHFVLKQMEINKFILILIFIINRLQLIMMLFQPYLNRIWNGKMLEFMNKISNYSLIVPITFDYEYSMFFIVFYILAVINVLSFGMIFFCDENQKISIFINKIFLEIITPILFLPSLLVNFGQLSCAANNNNNLVLNLFPNQICFQGFHFVNFIIAIFMIIFLLIYRLMSSVFFYET